MFRLALVALIGFASVWAASPHFQGVLERNPEALWSRSLGTRTRESLTAFKNHRKLPNGIVYGSIVRKLDLSKTCPEQIASWAAQHACVKQEGVLKDPIHDEPLHDSSGKTIPLLSYFCPDGGVVRLKPEGDPVNKYDRAPMGSIAMRFYGESRYNDFSDEAFKLDTAGLAIPKWPRDLNTRLPGMTQEQRNSFVNEWAHDAHTHLQECR